jgi:hypothetical protein
VHCLCICFGSNCGGTKCEACAVGSPCALSVLSTIYAVMLISLTRKQHEDPMLIGTNVK